MTVDTSGRHPVRCVGVLAAALTVIAALVRLVRPEVAAATSALRDGTLALQPFAVVLVWLAAAAALGCATWVAAITTVLCVGTLRGRVVAAPPGCPAALRRAVLLACGAGLAAGVTAPAHAEPVLTGWGGAVGDRVGIRGLPLPDRAEGSAGRRVSVGSAGPAGSAGWPGRHAVPRLVTVRPGDTLWAIAAHALPADAPDAAIDRRWRAIHRANADRLGDDPNLIHPGTELRVPRG